MGKKLCVLLQYWCVVLCVYVVQKHIKLDQWYSLCVVQCTFTPYQLAQNFCSCVEELFMILDEGCA